MDYFKLYKNIYDPDILLLHKGIITFELITVVLESLNESVKNVEEDKKVRKKLTNTLMESFQNLGHHAEKNPFLSNSEMFMVISQKNHYKVITGNLIENDKVKPLQDMLETINELKQDELREQYKKIISEDEFSSKNTAGLGFIDMARKTEQKFAWKFYKMDDRFSYFSFETKVKKEYQ